MASYQSPLRRGIKWYRKLMTEIIFNTTMTNSWIIFNKINNKRMSIINFREQVADSLVVANNEKVVTPKRRTHTLSSM